MRRVLAVLTLAVAGIVAGCGASAQGPTASPMPFADFLAMAQSFDAAEAGSGDDSGTLLERLDAAEARWAQQLASFAAVVPEPCYADALAELTGYWRDYAANYTDARPMMEAAKSTMGVLGIALMIEGVLAQAHPLAYPGSQRAPLHIIDALQTCEPSAPSPSPA